MPTRAEPPAFHDLDGAPLEIGLGTLLEPLLAEGCRVLVRLNEAGRIAQLDQGLWTYRQDSFLPHGSEGDPLEQPVWLSSGPGNPNGADHLVVVDDADMDDRAEFARTTYLFDRRNPAMRDVARKRFAEMRDGGVRPPYLRFGRGGWRQQ